MPVTRNHNYTQGSLRALPYGRALLKTLRECLEDFEKAYGGIGEITAEIDSTDRPNRREFKKVFKRWMAKDLRRIDKLQMAIFH